MHLYDSLLWSFGKYDPDLIGQVHAGYGEHLGMSLDTHEGETRAPWSPHSMATNVNTTDSRVVESWHQDTCGVGSYVFVWSNIYPTQIRLPDGEVFEGEPCEVIGFSNDAMKHRCPIRTPDKMFGMRWFARRLAFNNTYITPGLAKPLMDSMYLQFA